MEFRQLRYFIAVAEEGNIGAAARRLHISQPPITRQIQALEQDLGVVLFERTHRGVELTAAGTTFLEDARRLLHVTEISRVRSRAASRGEIGELRVAYFGTVVLHTLPLLLRQLLSVAPSATVSLTQMSKNRQIEALDAGTIDIGFGRFYPYQEGVVVRNVTNERLFLGAQKSRARSFGEQVHCSALRNEPLILFPREGRPSFADEVIGVFKRARVEPKVVAIVEDVNAAMALALAGVGVTIVPETVAMISRTDFGFTELVGTKATVPVSCIYRHDHIAPILETFLSLLPTRESQ
ncbi:LysR substrate-binding domain-containing protein [Cupriavidus sp. DF5525]|uniref:LysR substrate-binding domain-containing protein n=1 Tax=Cupriavidus sp. DF5525 TaxID=3160989 RepID=UPI0035A8B3B0